MLHVSMQFCHQVWNKEDNKHFSSEFVLTIIRLAGSHSSYEDAEAACAQHDQAAGVHGQLILPSDLDEAVQALAPMIGAWRMQVSFLPCALSLWVYTEVIIWQGEPEGICWIDGDGNEVDDSLGVNSADFEQEGEDTPTLVVYNANHTIIQVGDSEKVPFICEKDGQAGELSLYCA